MGGLSALTFGSLLLSGTVSALGKASTDSSYVRSGRSHSRRAHTISTSLSERELERRGPPAGWSLYVASGNDGGGCYVDQSNPRVIGEYFTQLGSSSVEAGLKACQDKGYKWAGLQYSNEVYCGNTLSSSLVSASSGDCSSDCASGEKCGGSWRSNIYQYNTPAAAGTWSLQGCYQDASSRALSGSYLLDYSMTPAKCQTACGNAGFKFAGLEYQSECYCGNTLSAQKLDSARCDSKCSGSGDMCGGSWTLSVYAAPAAAGSSTSTASEWKYMACVTDWKPRTLDGTFLIDNAMTNAKCTAFCASKGFNLAGTQSSTECYCDNAITAAAATGGWGKQVSEGDCNSSCGGDSSTKCGGAWRLSVYSRTGAMPTAAASSPSSSATPTSSSTSATPPPAQQTPTSYTIPTRFPGGSGGNKVVYAHFLVGNAYPYTSDTWRSDIDRAMAAGIDGFKLNLGGDSWQPARVADAYAAAAAKGFKMVLSFDMHEFSCGGSERVPLLQQYLRDFIGHSAAGKYNGRSILTTFAGESCTFGQGSVNNGWNAVLAQWRSSIYWAPAFNLDPMAFPGYQFDAEVNWGSAWPDAGKEIETSRDLWFMQNLGNRAYIGTVSPHFATHLPSKNWLWRGDNFLYGARWDQILSMRDRMDIVQIVSWNDYGESTYVNGIVGDMPAEARVYANNDFPHTALLSLQAFYTSAWRNGAYPTITKDQIWAMGRPHQAWATADAGTVPAGRDLTNDNFYVQVHLVAPATVTLCSGGSCSTKQGQAGINRFSQPLQVGQTASARVDRDGKTTASTGTNTVFSSRPKTYNFNYWISTSG